MYPQLVALKGELEGKVWKTNCAAKGLGKMNNIG